MDNRIKIAYLDYSQVFAGAERVLHTIIDIRAGMPILTATKYVLLTGKRGGWAVPDGNIL